MHELFCQVRKNVRDMMKSTSYRDFSFVHIISARVDMVINVLCPFSGGLQLSLFIRGTAIMFSDSLNDPSRCVEHKMQTSVVCQQARQNC